MKITILNMSDDTNKGDLAILAGTIQLSRIRWPAGIIKVINLDYGREYVGRADKFRHLKRLSVEHYGSFFPKVYTGKNRVVDLLNALKNFFASAAVLLAAGLFGKYARCLIFGSRRENFSAISEADLVLLKGGSYIFAFGGFSQLVFLYRVLFSLMVAITLRKRVVVLGQSIGPLKGRPAKFLARAGLERCEKIILREDISYNYLVDKLRVSPDRLEIWPDLAFWSPDGPKKLSASSSRRPEKIGFTFRDWQFPEEQSARRRDELLENYLKVMVGLIEDLARDSREIYVILHTLSDRAVSERIISRLNCRVKYFSRDYSVEELKSIYSEVDLLIGTRTHSCIFALSVGTPVIAIAYQKHKGYGIMDMAGQGAYVEDIYGLREERMMEKIQKVGEEYPRLQRAVTARVSRLSSEIEEKFSGL